MSTATTVYNLISTRARGLTDNRPAPTRDGVISFASGFPDPETLPRDGIAEATSRALSTHGQWPLQYAPTSFGYEGLIDFLVEKLARDQGIRATRENLILTSGGSQALALLCDLFLDYGDTVISEAPTWHGASRILKNVGARVESVPLDDDGVRVDALEAKLRELRERGVTPKFFYIIPNFQNPTGLTTTLERRQRIIALAEEYNLAILEDDAYHDLRFQGERLPTLYGLDGGRHVFYFATFSKIVAAGMRIGWIVGDPGLISRISVLKVDGGDPFPTHVAYEYCKDGVLERRIEELKATYQRRRDLMIGELSERMPEGCGWSYPQGGFFIWLTLPAGVDATQLLPKARERSLEFIPGTAFFFDGSGRQNIRLSFSYADEEQTIKGVQILAELVHDALAARQATR